MACWRRRRPDWGRHFMCWHAGLNRQVHVQLVPRPRRPRDAEGLTDQVSAGLGAPPLPCPRFTRCTLRRANGPAPEQASAARMEPGYVFCRQTDGS